MKTKTKTRFIILCIALIVACLCFAAGCGEESLQDYLGDRNAKQAVTYYANGGTFDGKPNLVSKNIYYPEGSPILASFDGVEDISIQRTGYVFSGWLQAELNEDGTPVYDNSGNLVATDKVIDLSTTTLTSGQHLYVCANWVRDTWLQIVLVTDGNKSITDTDGNVYEAGSVISEKTFGTSTSIGVTSSDIGFTSADFTYLQYYLDEACTQPFSGNFVKPTDGTQPYLYAKFIEGNYNIVRDKNDVNNMLNSSEEGTYYFFNTDASKVIDMTGVALKLKSGSAAMNVKIIGNGYTIKNLTYTVSNVNTQNGVYSMLGKLSASAEINDLTIENVNITLTTVRTSFSIYLVCSGIESGAKFNNFYINGINLTVGKISSSAKIENIPQTNGEYSKDNCLFGGYSSDVDFLAANGGITVSAVTLNLPTT